MSTCRPWTLTGWMEATKSLIVGKGCAHMGGDLQFLTRPAVNTISPWIKSISNELDIIIHVIASQLSGHCDVISNRLWRHQQKVMRGSETWELWVKILVLASFMDSLYRVRNKIIMYSCDKLFMHSRECYFGVYFTKITLSSAHKQFATRVHTLFSIWFARVLLRSIYSNGVLVNVYIYTVNWIEITLHLNCVKCDLTKCVIPKVLNLRHTTQNGAGGLFIHPRGCLSCVFQILMTVHISFYSLLKIMSS